jgi:hypothetical protein
MLVSALSVALLCAEQKVVPPLPMRKLSRTLSGADAAGTEAAEAAAAALMVRRMLRIIVPINRVAEGRR